MNTRILKFAVVRSQLVLVAMLCTVMGGVSAATFEQYPLMTGGSKIPPNIIFILDDSLSMTTFGGDALYTNSTYSNSTPRNPGVDNDSLYTINSLAYNPSKVYEPWYSASGTGIESKIYPNASISCVNNDVAQVSLNSSGSNISPCTNLANTTQTFYVPKRSGSSSTNGYDRYEIKKVGTVSKVIRSEYAAATIATSDASGFPKTGLSATGSSASTAFSYPVTIPDDVVEITASTSGGTAPTSGSSTARRGADLNVNNGECISANNGNNESCTISVAAGELLSIQIIKPNNTNFSNVTLSLKFTKTNRCDGSKSAGTTWVNCEEATPPVVAANGNVSSRENDPEIVNYANWYTYYRTRMKAAKAGASRAFSGLGDNYRVGLTGLYGNDTYKQSVVGTLSTTSTYIPFPVQYKTDDGLFRGGNRKMWFDTLLSLGGKQYTPLRKALKKVGDYYKDSNQDPYKNTSGSTLMCRQNFAILTTDGYWNNYGGRDDSDDNYKGAIISGDEEKGVTISGPNREDAQYTPEAPYFNPGDNTDSTTLADVAMHYWKTDLQPETDPSQPNNTVPTTAEDPAFWQHMVTFGVGLGVRGTLTQTDVDKILAGISGNWPAPVHSTGGEENPKNVDDLWHAAINGHGAYISASDSDSFRNALQDALAAISTRTASGSNIASSSTKTDAGTLTFSAKYTSGSWIGDLSASPFNEALSGVSTSPLWVLSNTFGTAGVNANFANRFVFTAKGGAAVRFDTSYADVSQFERTGGLDAVTGAENISYILGDQSKELGRPNGTLRKRAYPIGDIVDSSPAYIADTNTVYVGANDGMMHAINANNGKVLFSYIPKGMANSDLKTLSSAEYTHKYFMDGQIDVISRDRQGYSKNILIGAPGRGAKGVFALDVTNPATMSTAGYLWDNTGSTDVDMGYVLGAVRIRKSNKLDANGKNVVFAFVPNGIDSVSGKAVMFIYELTSTGAIAQTHKLTTDNTTGNGMMSSGLADLDGNGTMDTLYGGDLQGRIWKWDISKLDSANPVPTAGTKLFQATDGSNTQPITGGIGVARDTNGQIFIGFGTGRFLSLSDMPGNEKYVAQTQSMYGIKDLGTLVARADLEPRDIPFTGTINGLPARGFESYQDLPSEKKGWYINLGIPEATAAGERVISAPTMVGSAMWLTSVIPAQGSDCSGALGSGYLNVLNIFTGTSPLQNSYFDTNAKLAGANDTTGLVGSMGIIGGMPTEVNVTSQLATVGDGGGGSPVSYKRTLPLGGTPQRMTWREVVAPDN